MHDVTDDFAREFRRYKQLCERALAELDAAAFFRRPADHVNPVAVIVKHVAGNLSSRWTDFLTADGEKPDRDRDAEFQITEEDTRADLMSAWEQGWEALFHTLTLLGDANLGRTVTIREEPHTVSQALVRGLSHTAYHTGQILYVVRLLKPDSQWLTVPPGQSNARRSGGRGLR